MPIWWWQYGVGKEVRRKGDIIQPFDIRESYLSLVVYIFRLLSLTFNSFNKAKAKRKRGIPNIRSVTHSPSYLIDAHVAPTLFDTYKQILYSYSILYLIAAQTYQNHKNTSFKSQIKLCWYSLSRQRTRPFADTQLSGSKSELINRSTPPRLHNSQESSLDSTGASSNHRSLCVTIVQKAVTILILPNRRPGSVKYL